MQPLSCQRAPVTRTTEALPGASSGQLVACGPVPDAQRHILKQVANRANQQHSRTQQSIPAGLSTEEDFRTLTQMFVRDMFGQDPETTFYVSSSTVRAPAQRQHAGDRHTGRSRTERGARHRA